MSHNQEVSLPSGIWALTARITGTRGGSRTAKDSSHPAGFLARSSRTSTPMVTTEVYRPATEVISRRRSTARSGWSPYPAAVAAAITALDRLASPGRFSRNLIFRPSGVVRVSLSFSTDQLVSGRARPHSGHFQYGSWSRSRWPPHSGQHKESSCQRCPADTQVALGAPRPAQATSGSSALAITWVSVLPRAVRHFLARRLISEARSIWSRLRFIRTTNEGCVASIT